jgi:hypothetical protein
LPSVITPAGASLSCRIPRIPGTAKRSNPRDKFWPVLLITTCSIAYCRTKCIGPVDTGGELSGADNPDAGCWSPRLRDCGCPTRSHSHPGYRRCSGLDVSPAFSHDRVSYTRRNMEVNGAGKFVQVPISGKKQYRIAGARNAMSNSPPRTRQLANWPRRQPVWGACLQATPLRGPV